MGLSQKSIRPAVSKGAFTSQSFLSFGGIISRRSRAPTQVPIERDNAECEREVVVLSPAALKAVGYLVAAERDLLWVCFYFLVPSINTSLMWLESLTLAFWRDHSRLLCLSGDIYTVHPQSGNKHCINSESATKCFRAVYFWYDFILISQRVSILTSYHIISNHRNRLDLCVHRLHFFSAVHPPPTPPTPFPAASSSVLRRQHFSRIWR